MQHRAKAGLKARLLLSGCSIDTWRRPSFTHCTVPEARSTSHLNTAVAPIRTVRFLGSDLKVGGRRKRGREVEDEVERRQGRGGGAMGGKGAVKLTTEFTQTAMSARVEPLHCRTEEEEGESW
ncbi:hypothetical protein EYF80_026801 [Liparis tanakae]|uniref:Uncharacterized protein n=1 Tax=Liparis tanakae TaxID=230148 RepID=A0A4Z2HDX8_9TELE|nr:hypothetical protein EYF80_026801 [Liparis tanakae]